MLSARNFKRIILLTIGTLFLIGAGWGFAAPQTINCISAWPKTAFETSNLLLFIEKVQKEADQTYGAGGGPPHRPC